MAFKHRTLIVLITLILLHGITSTGVAKEEPYSARIGDPAAPNELTIYFSMGCSHCLTTFDAKMGVLQGFIDRGEVKVELIELYGFVSHNEDKEKKSKAVVDSALMSLTFACIAQEDPENAFKHIRTFIKSMKFALHGSDLHWGNWPYATPEDLNARPHTIGLSKKTKNAPEALSTFYHLESGVDGSNCYEGEDRKRLARKIDAQFKRFKATEHETIPLYILNGEKINHRLLITTLLDATKKEK